MADSRKLLTYFVSSTIAASAIVAVTTVSIASAEPHGQQCRAVGASQNRRLI
ncbi:MAG TPA: hypothetical protein VEJ87_15170 [Acidimicrobiales bacterium]|nr:hypothetical protein [Acidimicrobiales bacterium]